YGNALDEYVESLTLFWKKIHSIIRAGLWFGICTLIAAAIANMLPVRYSAKIDFHNFEAPQSSNAILACPRGRCGGSGSIQTRIYDISKEKLFFEAKGFLQALPRVSLLHSDESRLQIVAVQRSRLMGFPDTIWVQVVDVDEKVGLIIFSRSNYGLWDAGVNIKRVKNILTSLNLKLTAEN
ncbi:MAG: DUF1499 domain-containing protein, partial [Rhodospirillaceae bacterium]